jgi:hypothetical protein
MGNALIFSNRFGQFLNFSSLPGLMARHCGDPGWDRDCPRKLLILSYFGQPARKIKKKENRVYEFRKKATIRPN